MKKIFIIIILLAIAYGIFEYKPFRECDDIGVCTRMSPYTYGSRHGWMNMLKTAAGVYGCKGANCPIPQ